MSRLHPIVSVLGVLVVAGCASADRQVAAQQDDDKVYVTGSRLPVKSGSARPDASAVTDQQQINDMVRRGGGATGGVSGASGS